MRAKFNFSYLYSSQTEAYERHCATLASLQRVALKHFKEKLTILALSNYASIGKRSELESHLELLTDSEIVELCDLLHFRTSYPPSTKVVASRFFLVEVLLSGHEKRKTFQETARDLSILPTELSLFEPSTYLPNLNLCASLGSLPTLSITSAISRVLADKSLHSALEK